MADEMVPVTRAEVVTESFFTRRGSLAYEYTKPEPDPADRDAYLAYAAEVTALMSKADARISEVLGETIKLRHAFAHRVRIKQGVDQETGEIRYLEAVRTVLVDEDGVSYECVSEGALQGLSVLFQLFGHPANWRFAVPVQVKQIDTKAGFRTFSVIVAAPNNANNGETAAPRKRGRPRKEEKGEG